MKAPVALRLPHVVTPLYAEVTRMVTSEWADITITVESNVPGWRKGSKHVVPVWRLSHRRPQHRRRPWWRR